MASNVSNWLCLLAQRASWRHMGDRFSGENARLSSLELLLIGGGGLLIVLLILLLHRGALNAHGPFAFASNSSRRLFSELCRTHRIGFSHRRLLKRLARLRRLPSTAILFVEPESFDEANLPAELAGRANELEHIRHQLFGPRQTTLETEQVLD